MSSLIPYYDISPIGVIDRNRWTVQMAEISILLQAQAVYTPLISWDGSSQATGAINTESFELMEGEVDADPIPLTANYLEPGMGVDMRSREWTVLRYGDKVQYHKSDGYFNQFRMSGSRDWRPLLRSLLGYNVLMKHEKLARNVWFQQPQSFWTYAGNATSWGTITSDDRFGLDILNDWRFRLGNIGAPIIPGDSASAKVAMLPPGATYDFMQAIASASQNEASMWRDANLYSGQTLNYEIGTHKNIRFVEVPNDRFGINQNVFYNAGAITKQFGCTTPIRMGDGAPDPRVTKVDSVWKTGQLDSVTHYIQLENFSASDFALNQVVTIHTARTDAYGVTNGVNPFAGRTVYRRIVQIDHSNNRLAFDRPILTNYTAPMTGKSVTGNTQGTFYAWVTTGVNVGFALCLGSRGGVLGKVHEPIQFYEPRPIDDFDSVWRFTWDELIGYNLADPALFELHFFNVSIPKPGGIQ